MVFTVLSSAFVFPVITWQIEWFYKGSYGHRLFTLPVKKEAIYFSKIIFSVLNFAGLVGMYTLIRTIVYMVAMLSDTTTRYLDYVGAFSDGYNFIRTILWRVCLFMLSIDRREQGTLLYNTHLHRKKSYQ